MSIKSKVFAAAATLTLVGGVGAMAALSAGAATPSCGHDCLDLFSREFGTHAPPELRAWTCCARARRSASRSSCSAPATATRRKTSPSPSRADTSDFYAAGLVSSAVALHYGCTAGQFGIHRCTTGVDDPAFETEYAPYGVDSGLCVGVASTAVQNEGVSLQPCGVSSRTVWILDLNDSPSTLNHDYVPLINGSDTNFSHPFVLTYPKNGFPTDTAAAAAAGPEPDRFLPGHWPLGTPIGTVQDNQLWGADFGILR